MQTKPLSWHLVYIKSLSKRRDGPRLPATREPKMSKTAAIALSPSSSLFGRVLAAIDRALMASAKIAIRNGDLPRFGL
jgi:hypothetical protein